MELKRGSAESTLDDKGRVNIPARFREYFQGKLYITRGMDKCAMIMNEAVWTRFEQAEANSDKLNQEEREAFKNKHLNMASEVELDKAGRIAIPSIIRKYASLTRECIVIKDEARLLIWDSGILESNLAETDTLARAAMNKLGTQDIFKAE